MAHERFLITGGTGCIGSWVVRDLVREGVPVTVLTSRRRLDRLALLLSESELAGLDLADGDINDLAGLESLARGRGVTRVVHLAALQFPFCAADPVAGARIEAVEPAARGTLTAGDRTLPFPGAFDGTPFEAAVGAQPLTPLAEGVRLTIETYRAAIADGRIGAAELDRILAA